MSRHWIPLDTPLNEPIGSAIPSSYGRTSRNQTSPVPGGLETVPTRLPALPAEQLQHVLAARVRLGKHRRARLRQDLVLRELRHLRGHVEVTDDRLRGRQVLDG